MTTQRDDGTLGGMIQGVVRKLEAHRLRRTEAAVRRALGIPEDASPEEAARLAGDSVRWLEIVMQYDRGEVVTGVRDKATDKALWWGRWDLDGDRLAYVWSEGDGARP